MVGNTDIAGFFKPQRDCVMNFHIENGACGSLNYCCSGKVWCSNWCMFHFN